MLEFGTSTDGTTDLYQALKEFYARRQNVATN
jgi:hypothetical protein